MPSHRICNLTHDSLSLSEKGHLLEVAIPLGSGRVLDMTHELLGKKSGAIPCGRRKSKFNWAEPELTGDSGIAIQYHESAKSSFSRHPQCVSSEVTCVSAPDSFPHISTGTRARQTKHHGSKI